jgi:hypothetical protein
VSCGAQVVLCKADASEHEEEMFEDDPNEYIRRDLEPATGMSAIAPLRKTKS